nr:exopolysaccharide biosynthesis polyprenyl glycosylphosphotransferase [Streptomyces ruber]
MTGPGNECGGTTSVSVVPPRGSVRGAAGVPADRWPSVRARSSTWPLLAADVAAALLAAPAVTGSRTPGRPLLVAGLLLTVVCLNARARLYRPPAVPTALDELPAVCGRIVVAWCALAAVVAAYAPDHALPVRALLLGCAVQTALSCAGRAAVHGRRRRDLVRSPGAALVVGPAAAAQRVAAAFLRHPGCGLRPVGVVAGRPAGDGGGLPVLTTGEEVRRALVQNGVRTVLVLGVSSVSDPRPEHEPLLLRGLADSGCALWHVDADTDASAPARARAYGRDGERLAGFACRRLDVTPCRGTWGKRLLDVSVAGALLLLAGPLLLVTAVALRWSDGPGVVFRQERTGRDGLPFTLLKFRTHRPADAHEAATRWSVADEPEMSPFCRFLRRTSLDELPQLWNVLRGDMSLVGPRPERPYFVHRFSHAHPGYAARHRVRTGITGLAQIHGLRGDTSIEDRVRFDNAYIDDWSLWQDVRILLRTAATLVRPTGS